MRLIKIPDDGIVRIPIMDGDTTIGERRFDLSFLPTVEAEPVRHGRWDTPYDAFHDMVTIVCSCCGHTGAKHFHYCPHCGAKMDLKEKDK